MVLREDALDILELMLLLDGCLWDKLRQGDALGDVGDVEGVASGSEVSAELLPLIEFHFKFVHIVGARRALVELHFRVEHLGGLTVVLVGQ